MFVAARHARNGDDVGEIDRLADETVVGRVVLQGITEHVPASSGVNGVGVTALCELIGVGRHSDRDHNVPVGHRQRIGVGWAVDRARASGVVVLVAEGHGGAIRERQAHLFAAASVESAAVLDARAVGGDAAHGVFGGIASICHGDVFARGNAAHSLALYIAEGVGIVAVGIGGHRPVAGEGGTSGGDGCLALGQSVVGGGVEAVADGERATVSLEAHESSTVGGGSGGEQLAVEHAAIDVEVGRVVILSHESAVHSFAVRAALYDYAAAAVADGNVAVLVGDESCGVRARGLDGACDVQVLNHAVVLHIEEGCHVIVAAAVIEGQRLLVAVEGAHEVVVDRACHAGDADVVAQLHSLAAEASVGVDVL